MTVKNAPAPVEPDTNDIVAADALAFEPADMPTVQRKTKPNPFTAPIKSLTPGSGKGFAFTTSAKPGTIRGQVDRAAKPLGLSAQIHATELGPDKWRYVVAVVPRRTRKSNKDVNSV